MDYKQRNQQIYQDYQKRYREGLPPITVRELGKKYGISGQRVYQIIKKYGHHNP